MRSSYCRSAWHAGLLRSGLIHESRSREPSWLPACVLTCPTRVVRSPLETAIRTWRVSEPTLGKTIRRERCPSHYETPMRTRESSLRNLVVLAVLSNPIASDDLGRLEDLAPEVMDAPLITLHGRWRWVHTVRDGTDHWIRLHRPHAYDGSRRRS